MNIVNYEKSYNLLKGLQLKDAAEFWREMGTRPEGFGELGIEDVLEVLLTHELNGRDRRRQATLLKTSRVPVYASVNDVCTGEGRDEAFQKMMLKLSTLDFIKDGYNLTIFGGTGTGKTFIASALLRQCCMHGMAGRFFTTQDLIAYLQQSKGTSLYKTKRQSLARLAVLVIDDFGLTEYSQDDLGILYDVLNDRYGKKSTIVTSQKSPDIWLKDVNHSTLGEAVVERLSTNNYTLLLRGNSRRRTLAQIEQEKAEIAQELVSGGAKATPDATGGTAQAAV